MRIVAFLLASVLASAMWGGSVLAQQGGKRGGDGFKGPGHFTPMDRRDGARDAMRGDDRREHGRPGRERMSPEQRDKLRRDIEDANRGMERRRR